MKTLKTILITILCLSLTACMVACGASANNTEEPVSGGWSTGEPTEPTDEQKAIFAKATETMTGMEYTPVRLLGQQVVAGMNYRFLCKGRATVPGTEEVWAILEVYQDLEGSAEITNILDLTDAQAAQYGVDTSASYFSDMQIANPFVDCDSLDAAAEIAGFELTLPEALDGYPNRTVQAIENNLIQVFCADGDMAQSDTEYILLRKGVGSEDISGDYNEYTSVTEQDVDGKTVTLKGDGSIIYLATWTDGDYSYSVSFSDGADLDTVLALVNALK